MATRSECDTGWGDANVVGKRHISTLPRYWMTRLYVALSTLTGVYTMWTEPSALTHRLIEKSGQQGWMLAAGLAAVAMVAIADVIVNDLMPERFRLVTAKNKRHLVYCFLALGILCMTYVFVSGDGGWYRPLVLPFWIDALFAVGVAFFDSFQRHRAPQ
ncbi:hypothetical protein RD110_15640 [Rhodoferax koreense]|uniref:Uncharacterized protein n=1 Tax=Rhodoferax koreensis TaxID=1842727 RepID=A0A1P8JXK3_9BURK|nr:hypothetical protein [Rhodoferax koreense]APW38455.1 hypothetical protein RD110_15640 [Rhodoferax koreense]